MIAARHLLVLALLALGLGACAREAGAPRTPGWAAGWVIPAAPYEYPQKTAKKTAKKAEKDPKAKGPSEPASKTRGNVVKPVEPSPLRFAALPGVPTFADGRPKPFAPEIIAAEFPSGDACLEKLRGTGVAFNLVTDKRGVETPITLSGPIGGVRYWTFGGGAMVSDCRLALALTKLAPELRSLGITAIRFSGAYSYRMARVGRLSLHAHGLALDIHEVTAYGQSYVVSRDFARGLPNGCAESAPLLNRLSCRLAQLRMFQELLTPDSNADHHDHLHIAIARAP